MKLIPVIILSFVAFSCKKDEGKSTASEQPAEGAAESADPVDQAQAGDVALSFDPDTTPSRALDTLVSSLAEIPQSEVGTQLITAGTVAVSLLDSGYSDGECDGNGYPVAKAGEEKDGGSDSIRLSYMSPNYPQRHFYCQVKVGTSPETLLGSISINKSVLCALENAGALDENKFGQDQQVAAKIDTDCFTPEFVQNMQNGDKDGGGENGDGASLVEYTSAGEVQVSARFEKLTDHPNWDLQLTMSVDGDGKSIYYFRNTKDFLAGARVDETPDGTYGPGYVYSVSNDGKIRFENRLGPSKGSGFTGSQHIRLLVEGTFDPETKQIKSINRYEGASANLPEKSSGSIATIKGTLDGGFRTRAYSCAGGPEADSASCWQFSSFKETANSCVGKGKCEGSDGISLTEDTFGFMLPGAPADNVFMPAFLEKVKLPLAFESVTLSDIP